MSKRLVAYFSASGVTAGLARNLAKAAKADLFEIEPVPRYTPADLDWHDSRSRSSLEMKDPASRPPVRAKVDDMAQYDTVFVGFPIWWYVAPTIVQTFLESCDLVGKTIVPFATSGGSDMGKTNEKLADSCHGAQLVEGAVLSRDASDEALAAFAKEHHAL